jgi:hypothetical protein
MPAAEDGGIFISYRREDSSDFAGRLYDRLAARFGEGQVFMDVDTIELGVDFGEAINRAVAACKVLLAVIGPGWLASVDERGRRRLDNPDDFVRLEIEAALARDVRVIPILAQGAVMPGRDDLPESLAGLARRNALFIRHESFRSDAERLVTAIEGVLTAASGNAAVPSAPDAQDGTTTEVVTDKRGDPDTVDNESDLQAQASLVTAWSEPRIVIEGEQKRPVVVRNSSELPVHDVQTWLYLPDRYPNEQLQMPDPPKRRNSTRRGTVEPTGEFRRNVSVSGRGMETPPRVGVKFRDANGNLWWRDFNGGLHCLRANRTV